MSVSAEIFIGFAVEIPYEKDRDLIDNFLDSNPEYDLYNDGNYKNNIKFVIDGMCGDYIRLMYILSYSDIGYSDGYSRYDVLNLVCPEEMFEKLNSVYMQIYKDTLKEDQVKLISFVHYT